MRINLGDFVNGEFAVPENTVMRGLGDFVNAAFAVPENTIMRGLGHVGNFVPSAPMYPVPQNSVLADWRAAGMSGLGCGGSSSSGGCGCGCDKGMGQLSIATFTAPFTTAFTDIGAAFAQGSFAPLTSTDWLVIGGSAAAFFWLFNKSGHR